MILIKEGDLFNASTESILNATFENYNIILWKLN